MGRFPQLSTLSRNAVGQSCVLWSGKGDIRPHMGGNLTPYTPLLAV